MILMLLSAQSNHRSGKSTDVAPHPSADYTDSHHSLLLMLLLHVLSPAAQHVCCCELHTNTVTVEAACSGSHHDQRELLLTTLKLDLLDRLVAAILGSVWQETQNRCVE